MDTSNDQNEVLLRQRNEKLLNGLWEFYMVEQALDIDDAKIYLQKLGFIVENIIPVGKATHIFTHMKWNMMGYQCQITEAAQLDGYEFVTVENMEKLAMSTAIQYYRNWLDGKNAVQISLGCIGEQQTKSAQIVDKRLPNQAKTGSRFLISRILTKKA